MDFPDIETALNAIKKRQVKIANLVIRNYQEDWMLLWQMYQKYNVNGWPMIVWQIHTTNRNFVLDQPLFKVNPKSLRIKKRQCEAYFIVNYSVKK